MQQTEDALALSSDVRKQRRSYSSVTQLAQEPSWLPA